mgnify:CR=1 FL=1
MRNPPYRIGQMISIHALHEESDWLRYGYYVQRFIFQSTLSMRRATRFRIARTV